MDHLSLVGIVPWEFVAQIANLLIQAALFKKFLFKPVQGIIAKRRGEVNAIYGEPKPPVPPPRRKRRNMTA